MGKTAIIKTSIPQLQDYLCQNGLRNTRNSKPTIHEEAQKSQIKFEWEEKI